MLDISQELEARLELIKKRRSEEVARHATALMVIDHDEKILKQMLNLEKQLQDKPAQLDTYLRPGAANAIEDAILNAMSNHHEWDHPTLKSYLLKHGFGTEDDAQFGRSLQGTLLSMRGRELVELLGGGKWRIANTEDSVEFSDEKEENSV